MFTFDNLEIQAIQQIIILKYADFFWKWLISPIILNEFQEMFPFNNS